MIHTFFPFIHLTQVFFCFVFKLYTKSSPSVLLPFPPLRQESLFLSVSFTFFLSSPSLFLSLRTGSLQHTQVIVLFGGPQFEEAGPAVVKFEGSTLGSHGAGEHCHYCVEVSRVVAIALCSPHSGPGPSGGSWPRGTCAGTGAAASSASLGLLQPLDLGTAHRQLVEELLCFWTRNPLWQVCYLENSTHH